MAANFIGSCASPNVSWFWSFVGNHIQNSMKCESKLVRFFFCKLLKSHFLTISAIRPKTRASVPPIHNKCNYASPDQCKSQYSLRRWCWAEIWSRSLMHFRVPALSRLEILSKTRPWGKRRIALQIALDVRPHISSQLYIGLLPTLC